MRSSKDTNGMTNEGYLKWCLLRLALIPLGVALGVGMAKGWCF